MAQTSSSSIWDSLGSGVLAAGLSYAQSRGIDVPSNSGQMSNPDVAANYYGVPQADQNTVGAGTASGGSSTGTVLLVGGLILAAVLAVVLIKRR